MRIVAIINVRNSELYVGRCIKHLISQGVDVYLVDNDSSDNTVRIAEGFLGKGLMKIDNLAYPGNFNLFEILKNKERIIRSLDADWVMHYDVDEIREPLKGYENLKEAVAEADAGGYNAINFDEYVFVPTSEEERYEGKDYVSGMKYYYYFEPRKGFRRLNLWKNTKYAKADLISCGGHEVTFKGRNVFPESFALRHYIGLSWEHLVKKYVGRKFPEEEIKVRGWHTDNKVGVAPENIVLPSKSELKYFTEKGTWDKSSPKKVHIFVKKTDKDDAVKNDQ